MFGLNFVLFVVQLLQYTNIGLMTHTAPCHDRYGDTLQAAKSIVSKSRTRQLACGVHVSRQLSSVTGGARLRGTYDAASALPWQPVGSQVMSVAAGVPYESC